MLALVSRGGRGKTRGAPKFRPDRPAFRSVVLVGAAAATMSGCLFDPYGCATESRGLEAEATFAVPTGADSIRGFFRFSLHQFRGSSEQVSLTYGFSLGSRLQDSVAWARIHEGPTGEEGRVLLEFPAYPGPDGGPERVFSGFAPASVPGPLPGHELVEVLASSPAHLRLGFLAENTEPLASSLEVEGPSPWMDSCTS